ncbi:hypothetical protein EDD29_8344 [Actinocorallia herbida]|uniref:Uncharacterized protein n=1 Tax=Actinocorallia herbida TaxID=58109 RepID=A0A3N1DAQ6_9ACTN|nr:hypothetical protein [Actinocorallia herbida]ROO90612.1 hypothetical protein EDD29_8344 [Actinocorallia herbida]
MTDVPGPPFDPREGPGPADATRFDLGGGTQDPTRTRLDRSDDTSLDPTVTRREYGHGGTRPAGGDTTRPPASARPAGYPWPGVTPPGDDAVRVRLGSGPTGPQPMWSPDSVPARHRRRNSRTAPFLSVILSLAVIGALLAWLALRGGEEVVPLAVKDVRVEAPGGQQRCDTAKQARTVDLTAIVTLNGAPGVLSYRWVQSDGTPGAFQKATIMDGQTAFEAPLHWTVSGEGRKELTATFELKSPKRTKSSATFEYVCRP